MMETEDNANTPDQEETDGNEVDDLAGGIKIGDIYIPPPPMPACTFDNTGPRLVISHIENINFKSYAGYQLLGPLHKNFTAIVGPNGSGKSNVIDAMLFVFGYRAKKIRSKKVGVLIHKSDDYPNLTSCTVRVHFRMIVDKDDHNFDIVPDSGFCVARTAYKDNSSSYEVNGRKVQFKEVSKLLRLHGIDLDHNRFLILQGEIEMIAMMKPKGQTEHDTGMLEYLEDIIGCNRFIEPIKLFAAAVEELGEARFEKLNRVKTVEKEKDDLESAKDEALEYLKLENEQTLMENSVFQVRMKDAELDLEGAVESRNELKLGMDQLAQAQEEIKSSRIIKEKEHEAIHVEYEKCSKVVEECTEQYTVLERQDVHCRENVTHFKAKMKKLVKNLESEEQKLEDLKKQPAIYEGEASELEEKKKKLEAKQQIEEVKLKEVMATLKQETRDLQEEKDKLEAELSELKKTVNETKSKMDIAQSELDLYLSAEKNEQARMKDLETNLEQTTKTIKEKKRLHHEAESRIPEAEQKLINIKSQLLKVTEKEAMVSEEVKTKRMKVEEAKFAMNSNRSRGAVLQALMEQRDAGNIKGIYGRLGDLGAIDEKYDIAISTACGNLDHIVTDTMATAQKCVEFLKRSNKGYATFIALDKMQRWESYTRQKIQTPENVPRLFDVIRVKDTKVLTAFYFALRDTLVANDLEQATRIGLQGASRKRVVTLKGELIDLSGTMSGGGGKVSRGRMGQSVASNDISPRDLEKMVQLLEDITKKAVDLKHEKLNLEDCIDQTQKEVSGLQHALNKNLMEFKALQQSESSLAAQIKEQKQKVLAAEPDKNKVDQMQKAVEKAKTSYTKAAGAASKVDTKVQSLHSQIMEITEGKFGAVQKCVERLNNQIDGVQVAITKSKVAIKTANRNMKKASDKVESLTSEIEENKQSREKLMKEFKCLEESAKELMARKDAVVKEMNVHEEKKRAILGEIAVIKEKEHKLKSDNIELRNQYKISDQTVKEKQDYVKHWKIKLSKLKLQEIDGEIPAALPTLSTEELENVSVNALVYEVGALQAKLGKMKPNMSAIEEFRKKETIYKQRVSELEQVTNQRDEKKRHHDELRNQRLSEFMNGFKIITAKLKEMYQMITLGGDAELELVDSLDPFSEGIVFSVRPPKKSWKNITNLSGGEKTLSSLALVFALHYYKPTPFYVMDEIDAALDFKNVSIVGNYIKGRTKNAQFIIISLRNNMFELSDRLVGIFKTHNCTKSVAITPDEIEAAAAKMCRKENPPRTAEEPLIINGDPDTANEA